MTREEAIRNITHAIRWDDMPKKEALDMAIKALEQRWIPISERLPEVNQYVADVCKYYLIQDRYGDMHVAHYQEHGWESIESRLFIDAIAWMPLPKQYQESEEV